MLQWEVVENMKGSYRISGTVHLADIKFGN